MEGGNKSGSVGCGGPGVWGGDVMPLNLHKPSSTPHGGGGPGGGPVAAKKIFQPFLPLPRLKHLRNKWTFDYKRPRSIGRGRAVYGNFGVTVRPLAYIPAHRRNRLRNAPARALLN